MAKAKGKFSRSYNQEVQEPKEVYSGDMPKRGVYPGKLVQVSEHPTANSPDGLEWIFEVEEGHQYAGWRGYSYTNGSTTAWREIDFLMAGGIITESDLDKNRKLKKKLELDFEELVKQFGPVRLQVKHEAYTEGDGDPEMRAKLGRVLPPSEVQEAEGKGKGGKKKKSKKGDEPF